MATTLAWMFSLLTATSAVALVLMMLRIGTASETRASEQELPSHDEMRRFVLWKSFYVNPADPRGWVPKTTGYGWTVNFRTRENARRFASLIALCLGSAIGLTATVLLLLD